MNFQLRFTNREITPWGGISLMQQMLAHLNFDTALQQTGLPISNSERRHQSLGWRTPEEVYVSGVGGGAKIIDKWSLGDKGLEDIYSQLKIEKERYNEGTEQAGKPMSVPVESGGNLGHKASAQPKNTGQRCSVV